MSLLNNENMIISHVPKILSITASVSFNTFFFLTSATTRRKLQNDDNGVAISCLLRDVNSLHSASGPNLTGTSDQKHSAFIQCLGLHWYGCVVELHNS